MSKHQVIIVGGGPVGVGLAVELGMRGISCAVIERRTQLSSVPKGQGLQQRTLEHFFFWGIADELRAARTMTEGYPTGQITVYDDLRNDIWDAPAGREVVHPYYFQTNERLPQYRTEGVLRSRMAEFPHVSNYFGWKATVLEQDAAGVRVTVEKDGVEEVLEGDYLVGCDGGHSMVRDQADIERTGADFDEVMGLVVFRSQELHEYLERFPPRSTFRVVSPLLRGYWQFFGRVDVDGGFFFHAPIPHGSSTEDVDVAGLLRRATGFDFAFEVDHFGLWDLRVQVAENYRHGRVFIAGDAAHTHPPYGGFGLNNGLEDATNLGWKLAAKLEGWGSDALLDSYSSERRAIFRDIGEDIIAAGIETEREFLAEHSPEIDGPAFKDMFAHLAAASDRRTRAYEPHYDGSPVVVGAPGSSTGALGEHTFVARAGHHLAPQPLSSGRNVYEELGHNFNLLAFDVEDVDVKAFEIAAARLGIPLKVIRDTYDEGRKAYESRLILVRPDQFIAWIGDSAPADVNEIMGRVVGRSELVAKGA